MKDFFLSLVILALIVPALTANPRDDAAVALALAKAKRTTSRAPEVAPPAVVRKCFTDIGKAQDAAKRTGKQLIIWVGMECQDCPEVCDGLRDCVSCHAASYNGSATPRLCIPVEGGAWCFPKEKLGNDYGVESVRSVLGKPIPSESRRVIQPLRSAVSYGENCTVSG